jgi:hypothetical protein
MAKIKIEDVLDHLSSEFRRVIEDANIKIKVHD